MSDTDSTKTILDLPTMLSSGPNALPVAQSIAD